MWKEKQFCKIKVEIKMYFHTKKKGVRIMKKIRKILALALAIFMLAGLMPTNVFAEDRREKISNIVATSDGIDLSLIHI